MAKEESNGLKGRAVNAVEMRQALADALVPYLSNAKGYRPENSKMKWKRTTKHDAEVLELADIKTKNTAQDYLDMQDAQGVINLGFHVNPYKTAFRHHFKLGINFFSLGHLKADKAEKADRYDSPEDFIKHLFTEQQKKPHPGLWLIGGEVLMGAPYAVVLTILTNDGIAPLYKFETQTLSGFASISTMTTWTVAYSHHWSESPVEFFYPVLTPTTPKQS